MDENSRVVALGGAVAVAPNELITNSHVIEKGKTARVRWGDRSWEVGQPRCNPDIDLCALDIDQLSATPAPLRFSPDVSVGEKVYAVGAPEGLELSISEGLVSGIRRMEGRPVIQTSAPISRGSSGGGLFDSSGYLVGITTFMLKDGQDLNFALPTERIVLLTFDKPLLEKSLDRLAAMDTVGQGGAVDSFTTVEWLILAFKAEKMMVYGGALFAVGQAIKLNPERSDSWIEHGELEEGVGNYQDAIRSFKQAARLQPDAFEAWRGLGSVYNYVADYDSSAKALNKALALKPDDIDCTSRLGLAYEKLGQTDQATKTYQRVLTIDPCNELAIHQLAQLYQAGKFDLQRSVEMIQTKSKCGLN
jgi:hypothetical protein